MSKAKQPSSQAAKQPSSQAAIAESLEPRQLMTTTSSLGELSPGDARRVGVFGTKTFRFTLNQAVRLSASTTGDNVVLYQGKRVLAAKHQFTRTLSPGHYAIAVDQTFGGGTLSYKVSTTNVPTRLQADVWGSGAVHLNWDDNSRNEHGFRVERWTHHGWRRAAQVGANATAAVIDGLQPGTSVKYRVSALTSDGAKVLSANVVRATTQSEDTSGYYQVQLGSGSKGEASWDLKGDDTLHITKGVRKGSDTKKSLYIYASSWQAAVSGALTTSDMVDGNDDEKPLLFDTHQKDSNGDEIIVSHTYGNSGDFFIDTGKNIKDFVAANGGKRNDCDVPDSDDKMVVLEDSYGSIDRDFDDYKWSVNVTKVNIKSVKVASGADQNGIDIADYPDSYATAKQDNGDDVIVEAEFDKAVSKDDFPEGTVLLSGGEAVDDNILERKVSTAVSAKTTVSATSGVKPPKADIWVVSASVQILVAGARPPNAPQEPANSPRPSTLGPITYVQNGRTYGAGQITTVGVLSPAGVGDVVTSGWGFVQQRISRDSDDGQHSTKYWNATWVDDTALPSWRVLTPINDTIYTQDGPNIGPFGTRSANTFNNFQDYVTYNGKTVSNYGYWYYVASWSAPDTIVSNHVGTGSYDLPPY